MFVWFDASNSDHIVHCAMYSTDEEKWWGSCCKLPASFQADFEELVVRRLMPCYTGTGRGLDVMKPYRISQIAQVKDVK